MTVPDRAAFAGGRGFVGTDRPVIRADGEGPRRPVRLAPFAIETETVTNARFAAFVAATGFRTEAERFGWSAVFRGLLPEGAAPVLAARDTPWWIRIDGASWSAPEGPGSEPRRTPGSSGRPGLLVRRRRLRGLGGRAASVRGGMGARRAGGIGRGHAVSVG